MNTIFIIGNGFDLAHNLNTSYVNFINSIDLSKSNNQLLHTLQRNSFTKWSDIEYTYFTILNKYSDTLFMKDILKSNPYTSTKEFDNEFEELKTKLENYLQSEQTKFNKITSYINLFEKFNSLNTLILDFNYTETVKKYLGQNSRIVHIKIHGELKNDENPIIFGYAANKVEASLLSNENDEYLMKNIKKICYMLSDNKKKFENRLNESDYSDINVYILGHSCGISDRLILNEIFKHKKVTSITPLYYKNNDEYKRIVINIDRIIDDYNESDPSKESFYKIKNFTESTEMIQHNSDEASISKFESFLFKIKNIALMQEKTRSYF